MMSLTKLKNTINNYLNYKISIVKKELIIKFFKIKIYKDSFEIETILFLVFDKTQKSFSFFP